MSASEDNEGDRKGESDRASRNAEALEYYRRRSRAPGVAEGGEARNFYCMECDGVIPFERAGQPCPHCGADTAGAARRYFNWVEIDRPPPSDLRALLSVAGVLAAAVALLILGALLLVR